MKRIFIVLLLCLPWLVGFAPAQQSGDVSLEIDAGIAGWYRAGQWIPLQISVTSGNTDVQGQLQVRVGSTVTAASQSETTYRTPFTIAAGDNKRVFLYVSLDDFTRTVQVELVDNDGNVVSSQQDDLTQIDFADTLYIMVSDTTTGVLDAAQLPIGRGRNFQANWRVSDLPANPDALRSADVLIFSDVDTGQLATDQQQAIRDWVMSGGHLIVTGGTNWQRTTAGLLELLPTVPESTSTLDNSIALGEFLGEDTEVLSMETLATDNTPAEDAFILLEDDNVPLLVRQFMGYGTVDFVAVDATVEPLRSWIGLDRLWHELVISAPARPSWSHGIERFEVANDAASNVTGFNLPGFLQLSLFLFVYILLIGPINYIVLHQFKRREFAWFTIPLLIVAFTAFAYFTGFSLRGDAVTVNQVSVIQMWDDYDRARVDGMIGILSPRRTTYDVLVRDDLYLRAVPNESANVTELNISEGVDYAAEDIPVDAAIMTGFATSGYMPAPDLSGEANWRLSFNSNSARVTGTVINQMGFTLEDAVILADDEVEILGDLNSGASYDFEMQVNLNASPRLPLGHRVSPDRPVINPGRYWGGINECTGMPANSLNVFYENVLSDQQFECIGGSEGDRRWRRRALVLAAISNEIDRNGGRGSGVYLIGWSEEPPLRVDIPDTDQILDGTALYIYKIPTTIEYANPTDVTLPPGMIGWTQIEQSRALGNPEANPDLSFSLSGTQSMSIRFMPLPEIPFEEVTSAEVTIDWLVTTPPIVISLWNWEEAEWQGIDFTEENFRDDELQLIINEPAYIGPQNAIQLQVEAQNPATAQPEEIRSVRVTMRGRS